MNVKSSCFYEDWGLRKTWNRSNQAWPRQLIKSEKTLQNSRRSLSSDFLLSYQFKEIKNKKS